MFSIGLCGVSKLASAANLNRAATAARAAGKIGRENQDVAQATESVQAVQTQIDELNAKIEEEASDQLAA